MMSALRSINATTIGPVLTAAYRLLEVGYLTLANNKERNLAPGSWWAVVAALAYPGTACFKVAPVYTIVLCAVLSLCWYGAVGRS